MKADIPDFKCNNCGICCKKYVGSLMATVEDMKRWEDEERDDILERTFLLADEFHHFRDDQLIADLWITKQGNEPHACPWWHRSTGCRIHDTKPQQCRDYPISLEQAVRDGCEGVPQEVNP